MERGSRDREPTASGWRWCSTRHEALGPVLALARDLREQGKQVLLERRAQAARQAAAGSGGARATGRIGVLGAGGAVEWREPGRAGRGRRARDGEPGRAGGGPTACGALRSEHVGQTVTLMGWAHRRRDHGGLVFIDLRDREGLTQCVFNPARGGGAHARRRRSRAEFVLAVRGRRWRARPAGTENPKLATGESRSRSPRLRILNESRPLPFQLDDDAEIDETLRLKYRYLDLRRPHDAARTSRSATRCAGPRATTSHGEAFLEVETPFLTPLDPGGRARLPGAEPAAARELLRAAPVPAALQAAADGGGLRALLPDRALLPRRGPPATASPSSPRSTSRPPSSTATTSCRSSRAWWPRSGGASKGVELAPPVPAHPLRRGDRRVTARTSPTCASASSSGLLGAVRERRVPGLRPDGGRGRRGEGAPRARARVA